MSALELRVSNVASRDDNTSDLPSRTIGFCSSARRSPSTVGRTRRGDFPGKITGLEVDSPKARPRDGHAGRGRVSAGADGASHEGLAGRLVAEVASAVASQLNLKPVISGFTDSIPALVQFNESDLAFLRRLLARYDADLQVVGEELHVSAAKGGRPRRDRAGTPRPAPQARVLADLSHQVTEVTVTGWDVKQGSRISGSSTGSNLRPGTGTAGARCYETPWERGRNMSATPRCATKRGPGPGRHHL